MSGSREMLTALFERGSGSFIELRCINRATGKVDQHYFGKEDLATLEEAAQAYSDAVDVYFGVAMRTRRSGGKDAVGGVQALWADVDTPEATLELTMFEPPPSIVVASGSPSGYHAYWLLDDPLGVPEAEELLRLANRILRVPNTLNHKSSPPAPVLVLELDGHVYTSEALRAAVTPEPRAALVAEVASRTVGPAGPSSASSTSSPASGSLAAAGWPTAPPTTTSDPRSRSRRPTAATAY
jgi:hypothetical protein